jgi:hypothetical protein
VEKSRGNTSFLADFAFDQSSIIIDSGFIKNHVDLALWL